MDQLIDLVVQRTGISQDQARQAVQTVLGFAKDRLPAPIASQLESALSGQSGTSGGALNQMQQGLGNFGDITGNQP